MSTKKILSIFLSIVAFFTFISNYNPVFADNLEQSQTFRVGMYDNAPKLFYNDNGEPDGFWPDIINYIAIQEGWDIEYVDCLWEQCLQMLREGQIDIMPDVAYSMERGQTYELSGETVLINWGAVYASPGLEINSFTDLEGKNIAVLKSGIHFNGPLGIEALMDSFNLEANYIGIDVYEDAFKAVDDGRADIAVVNRIFGIENEPEYNIERTNIVFNPIELKFALTQEGEHTNYLLERLDFHIKDLKEDNSSIYYQSIIEHLRGVEVEVEVEVVPAWLTPVLVGVMSVVFILLGYFIISRVYQAALKREVQEKTSALLKSETKFKELTDLLPQGVFEIDNKGTITYVNEFVGESFGYDKKDLENKQSLEVFFSNGDAQYQKLLDKDLNGSELVAVRKDGSEFPAVIYYSKIMDNDKLKGLRGIIIDITKQKELQRELDEKVEELKKVMEATISRELKMAELKKLLDDMQSKN